MRQRTKLLVSQRIDRIAHGRDTIADACAGLEVAQSLQQIVLALLRSSLCGLCAGIAFLVTGGAAVLLRKLAPARKQLGIGKALGAGLGRR